MEQRMQGAVCCVLLLKPGRMCQVAACNCGKDMLLGLEGFRLEQIAGALGAGPDFTEMIFAEDLAAICSDRELKEWAAAFDLRSCWLAPVVKPVGQLEGLIVVFFRDKRQASPPQPTRPQPPPGLAPTPTH